MTPNSFATYSTVRWTKEDQLNSLKSDRYNCLQKMGELNKALKFKSLNKQYEIWKVWFITSDYDEWSIDVEFPVFRKQYKKQVNKLLSEQTKRLKKISGYIQEIEE